MVVAAFFSLLSEPLPCPMPHNHKQNVLSASLNKTFPFFLPNKNIFNADITVNKNVLSVLLNKKMD